MTEIYKNISQLNPEFMWSYFTYKDMPYNLSKGPILGLPKTHSFYHGTNAIDFCGFLILNTLLLLQSPAIHYLDSKIKPKILEILIADV